MIELQTQASDSMTEELALLRRQTELMQCEITAMAEFLNTMSSAVRQLYVHQLTTEEELQNKYTEEESL